MGYGEYLYGWFDDFEIFGWDTDHIVSNFTKFLQAISLNVVFLLIVAEHQLNHDYIMDP